VSHNLRFTEVELSINMGIKVDDWYAIPLEAREQMVAAELSKRWIESLLVHDAKGS